VKGFNESLDKRENPRRDVTHYESPPRKRDREEDDKIIQGYQRIKPTVRKSHERSGPAEAVDRLIMTGKEYDDRKAYLRKKVGTVSLPSYEFSKRSRSLL
jgi:hypothetical protein